MAPSRAVAANVMTSLLSKVVVVGRVMVTVGPVLPPGGPPLSNIIPSATPSSSPGDTPSVSVSVSVLSGSAVLKPRRSVTSNHSLFTIFQ